MRPTGVFWRQMRWAIWLGLPLFAALSAPAPADSQAVMKRHLAARKGADATGDGRSKYIGTRSIADDFNDNQLDLGLWRVASGLPLEQSGLLLMDTSADITMRAKPALVAAGVDAEMAVVFVNFSATGEGAASLFIDSETTTEPFSALLSIEVVGGVRQASFFYYGFTGGGRGPMTLTTNVSVGRLWMIYHRQAGVLEGLIDDGTGWHSVGSVGRLTIADSMPLVLALSSDATGAGNSMTVSFDNFLARGVTEPLTAVKRRSWMLYR